MDSLTEAQAEKLGQEIARLMSLTKNRETGRYDLEYGDKTAIGLGRVVQRLYQESLTVPDAASHIIKGHVTLLDNRVVPEFQAQYTLPIETHRPHKWAMVDMETGQVLVMDPDQPPTKTALRAANKAELKLIRKESKR